MLSLSNYTHAFALKIFSKISKFYFCHMTKQSIKLSSEVTLNIIFLYIFEKKKVTKFTKNVEISATFENSKSTLWPHIFDRPDKELA